MPSSRCSPFFEGVETGCAGVSVQPSRSQPSHDAYPHFFRPPTDVSVFCPGGHLPVGLVSGLPLPGPSSIAAYETPLNAKAIAAANSAMRFFIAFTSLLVRADPLKPQTQKST